jgi:hypothetical protein
MEDLMTDDKKEERYVLQKPPIKPVKKPGKVPFKKGFVPPPPPAKRPKKR